MHPQFKHLAQNPKHKQFPKSNMVVGPDLRIRGSIGNIPCSILIDTGCTNTIVRKSVIKSSGLLDKMSPCSDVLRMANGDEMGPVFEGNVPIEINGIVYNHVCYVVEKTTVDVLLGANFMAEHKVVVDAGRRVVNINNTDIPCLQSRATLPKINRVITTKPININPGQELVVPARVARLHKSNFCEGIAIVEPVSLPSNSVLIGRTLVSDIENPAVRLNNITDEVITVPKNRFVGFFVGDIKNVTEVDDNFHNSSMVAHATAPSASSKSDHTVNHLKFSKPIPDHMQSCFEDSIQDLQPSDIETVRQLLCNNSDVFAKSPEDLGHTSIIRHHIDTGDARPIKQRARRQPSHWVDVEEKEIKKMCDLGICKPSTSPWSSPVVLVKKDNSCRFCVDYRILNKHTLKDSYPLLRIEDCLDNLSGSKYFATLDLASGYWQVALHKESQPKTAFSSRHGLFEFTVMPYGLCNAPALFERLMERVLAGLQWKTCLVYIDDIIVHGSTVDELASRLQQSIFDRLRKAGLKLKPSKCHLFKRSVEFLGHVVTENGITTCTEKVKRVQSWPIPASVTELRSFLGLCSYYRRFIRNFATVAKPLHDLTSPGVKFHWTDTCQHSFEILKTMLCHSPVLAYPSREGKFILDTDTSDYGIGGVLSQIQDGREHVIAYASRCLSGSERKYCTTRKEILAVKFCLEYFHHYLYGRHFHLRTDHAAIRWMLEKPVVQGKYGRWLTVLSTYDFSIEHRPGNRHSNADGLSRIPCHQCAVITCVRWHKKSKMISGLQMMVLQLAPSHGLVHIVIQLQFQSINNANKSLTIGHLKK